MKMHELISWFQLEYPELVQDMKNCNHHKTEMDSFFLGEIEKTTSTAFGIIESLNPYHLESDIFTHTMMVCKQAENAPYEVQIAALLHDIGKPSTRKVNPKNGNVSFYNHDAVSAFMALEILNREELCLSKDQKVRIFNMIALHTQIYKLSVEQLAETCDQELIDGLIMLGNADHEGRFHTAGDAIIPESIEVMSRATDGKTKEVVVLCGLPGAGKTSYINDNFPEANTVSRDNCLMDLAAQHFQAKDFTYSEAWNAINQKDVDKLLQMRFNNAKDYGKIIFDQTVIDMTHMSKKSRRRSLSHFGSEYKKKCVVFLPDMQKLFLQNENRHGKIIGRDVIEKMMRSFYPPTMEEFDEIEYVI